VFLYIKITELLSSRSLLKICWKNILIDNEGLKMIVLVIIFLTVTNTNFLYSAKTENTILDKVITYIS
jgi:hypothetical protein